MWTRAMCALANVFAAAGMATVSPVSILGQAPKARPRALYCEFPLGRPGDPSFQHGVLARCQNSKRRHPIVASSVLVCVLFTYPSSAMSQASPSSSNPSGMPSAKGQGFKLGQGRLHPYFQLETGYETNPGKRYQNNPSDLVLKGRPGLKLEYPNTEFDLNMNASLQWSQYLGLENKQTGDFSGLMARTGFGLLLNKNSAVNFKISNQFARTN